MATMTLPPATDRTLIPTAAEPPERRPQLLHGVGLATLLVGTAVLYLWGLSASGYANSYYSAAVQAGSQSWTAFLFGSLDAGNAITVDKPPASLWLMALSVRIFGLSSWSILVPQALLGVASVAVLYASVRRTSGHAAGLVAGALLALTPVATLMFRFNNPDALLTFGLVAAAYATLRATERASGKWLAGAGVLVGLAFLTKMLQAFLVLPAFALVYLLVAPTTVRRRLLHLLGAFAALVVSAGWWVALVELVPESWRPYVGGSETNSVLELILGYNGLGRILGQGGGGPGGGGASFGSYAGPTRMFEGVSGGMISWLIPAALLLGAVALVALRRAPRTDLTRAALGVWGGWLLVTAGVFSFMAGTYHDYYTVALAPAVAALVAVGGAVLWAARVSWPARAGLAAGMIATAVWAFVLLGRSTAPYDALQWPVLVVGVVAGLALLIVHRLPRALASLILGVALVGATTGPAAYAMQTAATLHTGSIVTAGPVSASETGGPGGEGMRTRSLPPGAAPGGGMPGGGPGGGGPGATVSSELTSLLTTDADAYTWVAATNGAQSAAGYQLATERPVLAIGGWTNDPSPTLAEFQALVAQGEVHYYLTGGSNRGGGGRGGAGAGTEIASWVSENFAATTVGGVTVYDLTGAGS